MYVYTRNHKYQAGDFAHHGFTLIELAIVIAVLGLITGTLSLNYSKFTQRQKVKQDALTMKQNLRLVQTKAKSGDRGACAAGSLLYGWRVHFALPTAVDPATIVYQPSCPDAATLVGPTETVKLKPGVTFEALPADIYFRPLNLPVDNPVDIILTNGSYKCTVSVSTNGEISDQGCTI